MDRYWCRCRGEMGSGKYFERAVIEELHSDSRNKCTDDDDGFERDADMGDTGKICFGHSVCVSPTFCMCDPN